MWLYTTQAQQLGVPLGKLLGELKSGRSVTLSDGRVVEPSECVSVGQPGAVVVLLSCPTLAHIEPLAAHSMWTQLPPPPRQSPVVQGEESDGGGKVQAGLIVHFSSREILCDARSVHVRALPSDGMRVRWRSSALCSALLIPVVTAHEHTHLQPLMLHASGTWAWWIG